MPPTRHDEPDEDALAFAEAVKDVKPLPPHNLAGVRRARPVVADQSAQSFSGNNISDENGCVAKTGIQQSVLRKIRNGQIPVEDELDLHGLTTVEAEPKLRVFLQRSRLDRQRVVRIIHGKGHGSPSQESILRAKVNDWLCQSEDVLAFCPAGPTDGGTGAVRVLLRRRL
jgi:DNA-nicking Smr family endonuclease